MSSAAAKQPARANMEAVAALLALLAAHAGAAEVSDPFATEALTRPPYLAPGSTGISASPCRETDPGVPLSLPEVVDAALCNNPQTRELWANARARAAQVGAAEAAYLPTLSATASLSRNWTSQAARTGLASPSPSDQNSIGASLSYLLFDFGSRSASLENAQQVLAAANATQDATIQSIFLSAAQAFFQVRADEAALVASRESEKAARESFSAADARYRAGAGTPADKLQAQTAYSQATLTRIKAEGELRTAQGVLANVIGRDAGVPVALIDTPPVEVPPRFEADIAALIEDARRMRPDLRAAEAEWKAAQAGIEAARASGMPALSLGATTGEQNATGLGSSRDSSLGVTLTIPLFSGFDTTYRIRSAQEQVQAKAAQRDRLRLQIALDVWKASQSLITATQTVRSTQDLMASAEQSERVAIGRYRAGVGNILDVLNAQNALAGARQQQVQAFYNWNISRIALAQTMGVLDRGFIAEVAGPGKPAQQGTAK